jgi:hypothetical protein
VNCDQTDPRPATLLRRGDEERDCDDCDGGLLGVSISQSRKDHRPDARHANSAGGCRTLSGERSGPRSDKAALRACRTRAARPSRMDGGSRKLKSP